MMAVSTPDTCRLHHPPRAGRVGPVIVLVVLFVSVLGRIAALRVGPNIANMAVCRKVMIITILQDDRLYPLVHLEVKLAHGRRWI